SRRRQNLLTFPCGTRYRLLLFNLNAGNIWLFYGGTNSSLDRQRNGARLGDEKALIPGRSNQSTVGATVFEDEINRDIAIGRAGADQVQAYLLARLSGDQRIALSRLRRRRFQEDQPWLGLGVLGFETRR